MDVLCLLPMREPSHRRSMEVGRPAVDPSIRGIPQGWDDGSLMTATVVPPSRTTDRLDTNQAPLRSRVKLASFANRRKLDGAEADGGRDRRSPHFRPKPSSLKEGVDQVSGFPRNGIASHNGGEGKPRQHGQKCTWGDCIYKVGYERQVLDTEARMHETMLDLIGSHTFATFQTTPTRVLDIGTGLGLWPIAQSRIWPDAEFIGLDRVSCQLDIARLRSRGQVGKVDWVQADFLKPLPYSDGYFDHVHLRFVALGVPEPQWPTLLEECCRVLKAGGKLEIVETSYDMPSAPTSFQASFASLLIANSIADVPAHAVDFVLPMLDDVVPSSLRAVYRQTFESPPGAMQDATATWITSALDYKTSFIFKGGTLGQAGSRLGWKKGSRVEADCPHPASLWAWVVEKI